MDHDWKLALILINNASTYREGILPCKITVPYIQHIHWVGSISQTLWKDTTQFVIGYASEEIDQGN